MGWMVTKCIESIMWRKQEPLRLRLGTDVNGYFQRFDTSARSVFTKKISNFLFQRDFCNKEWQDQRIYFLPYIACRRIGTGIFEVSDVWTKTLIANFLSGFSSRNIGLPIPSECTTFNLVCKQALSWCKTTIISDSYFYLVSFIVRVWQGSIP